MSHEKCQNIQLLIPLWFNGQLSELEKREVAEHLKSCPDCRQNYEKEQALFIEASVTDLEKSEEKHPDTVLMDRFAHQPENLSADEIFSTKEHLKDCPFCQAVLEQIKLVSINANYVISDQDIPTITGIDREIKRDNSKSTVKKVLTKIFDVKYIPRYAAAAAILLIFVYFSSLLFGPGDYQSEGVQIAFVEHENSTQIYEQLRSIDLLPEITVKNGEYNLKLQFNAFPDEEVYALELLTHDSNILAKQTILPVDIKTGGFLDVAISARGIEPGQYSLLLITIDKMTGIELSRTAYPFIIR